MVDHQFPDNSTKHIQDTINNAIEAMAGYTVPIRHFVGIDPAPHVRPSFDQWGLGLAHAVSMRADCTRRQVGAVIMGPDRSILSTGYNGAPSGQPGCLTAGACPRGRLSNEDVPPGSSYDTGAGSCIAVHAEANALLRADWSRLADSTIYCTEEPCDGCMRLIKGTPIARLVTSSGVLALKP